jgi:MFS transporter, DHA1 family, multidrug resistance protein
MDHEERRVTASASGMEDMAGVTEAPARHRNDWRVLLALFIVAGIVESQAFGHLSAFTPIYLDTLGVPPEQISTWTGILSALAFVIGLPLLPFWGVWADKYNRKLIIVRSAYVEGVIFGLAALSPNVWVLAVARLLGGFVLGNTGVMLALLADVTPRKRLGLAVGLASSGFPIGLSIGPYLGGVIVQNFDVRVLLGVDAVASALVGVALTLFVREEPRLIKTTRSVGRMLRDSLRSITGSAITLRLFALYFLAALASGVANPFVPILVRQLHLQQAGLPAILPTVIGVTLTGAGIASAIMTPIWGRLGDVIGRWTVLPICVGAVALALGVEAFAPSLRVFQVAFIGAGFFQGAIGATVLALLATITPEDRRATILNFSLMPFQLALFFGPILGAGLAYLALRLPFGAGAWLAFIAFTLAVSLAQDARSGARSESRSETQHEGAKSATLAPAD